MPGGDGTGPAGLGPMTGRAAGYCAGYTAPGYASVIGRRGFWGGGRGGGWGRRNWFYASGLTGWQRASLGWSPFPGPAAGPPVFAVSPSAPSGNREQQLDALKGQADYLENALEGIRRQIEELESKTKQERPQP